MQWGRVFSQGWEVTGPITHTGAREERASLLSVSTGFEQMICKVIKITPEDYILVSGTNEALIDVVAFGSPS